MEYLNAKQIIGRLKMGGVTNISESYFSQLVRDGNIPTHRIPGKRRKMYLYDEVKQALDNIKDPSRDAVRERHERDRQKKKKAKLREETMEFARRTARPLTVDMFTIPEDSDITQEELKEELCAVNAQNLIFLELLAFYKEAEVALLAGKRVDGFENRWMTYFTKMLMTPDAVAEYLDIELIKPKIEDTEIEQQKP